MKIDFWHCTSCGVVTIFEYGLDPVSCPACKIPYKETDPTESYVDLSEFPK